MGKHDDDFMRQVNDYVEKNAPKKIEVPDDISEDEAVLAIQKQFEDAGFGCDRDTALEIIQEARDS
ncbi:hypothetical protein [Mycobacteroides abscessus]|uniref:hypothetical protein n=1 Tax=Mycobacteroides abscessus TaxID=36809 RepID=UPI00189646B1